MRGREGFLLCEEGRHLKNGLSLKRNRKSLNRSLMGSNEILTIVERRLNSYCSHIGNNDLS